MYDLSQQPAYQTALAAYADGRFSEALSQLLTCLEADAAQPDLHYLIGLTLEHLGEVASAIQAYQTALSVEPQLIDAWNNLGNLWIQQGDWQAAQEAYANAIAANPDFPGSYLNLGNLLLTLTEIEAAIQVYQQGLQHQPHHSDLEANLAVALEIQQEPAPWFLSCGHQFYEQGLWPAAIAAYQKFLAIQDGPPEVYQYLSECYDRLEDKDTAIQVLRQGLTLYPENGNFHFALIRTLRQKNRIAEALAAITMAQQQLPDYYIFRLFQALIVPLVYHTAAEIDVWRQRFVKGLQTLVEQTALETVEQARAAVEGFMGYSNFYLVYQAQDDRPLQQQYGQLVHRAMAKVYPDWVKPRAMPPRSQSGRLRIGYLSAYLHSYSGTLWLTGWLKYADRSQFELYGYYTGDCPDLITQQFQNDCDYFYHIPDSISDLCQQVTADQLHVLVIPEIGMNPAILCVAALRLAPVQCTAWGHPVTSGLPTIDYFLSSELMEPEQGQLHYTETLVKLPHLGIAYPSPPVPALSKSRQDFHLPEEAVLYLCCQAPFKYLPQHDYLLVEIARQVPQALFLFLRADELQPRLHAAFAAAHLDGSTYCRFLPCLGRADYLMLNQLADIYLDSIGFTGGNTTLDALACGLPVVTLLGEFMRGRMSAAMLQRMGITETIAKTEADYQAIAIHLGQTAAARQDLATRIRARQSLLFEDQSVVRALEAFYQEVTQTSPSSMP